MARTTTNGVPIDDVAVGAYRIATDTPESDGTFSWDSTTIVVVEVSAGRHVGLGYTYEHQAAATLIHDHLAHVVVDADALATRARWSHLIHAVRNIGRPGHLSRSSYSHVEPPPGRPRFGAEPTWYHLLLTGVRPFFKAGLAGHAVRRLPTTERNARIEPGAAPRHHGISEVD